MPSTARLALPYPASTDTADVPRDMAALANALDTNVSYDAQGTLSARPAAGLRGRYYYATDIGVLSRDTGTGWVDVNPKDAAAATPSLRTLGAGATQAAAGNDARLSDTRTPTDGTVTNAKLAPNAVTTDKVAPGTLLGDDIADGQITPLKQSSAVRGEWRVAGVWSGGPVGYNLAPDDGSVAHDLGYVTINAPPIPAGLTREWRITYVGWTSVAATVTLRDAFQPANINSGSVTWAIGANYRSITPAGGAAYAATLEESTWSYFQWFNSGPGTPTLFEIMIRYRFV
jgi:hypothetical protein